MLAYQREWMDWTKNSEPSRLRAVLVALAIGLLWAGSFLCLPSARYNFASFPLFQLAILSSILLAGRSGYSQRKRQTLRDFVRLGLGMSVWTVLCVAIAAWFSESVPDLEFLGAAGWSVVLFFYVVLQTFLCLYSCMMGRLARHAVDNKDEIQEKLEASLKSEKGKLVGGAFVALMVGLLLMLLSVLS